MIPMLLAQCSCGRCQVQVKEPLITRFYCHCSICRQVYKDNFSDVTVQLSANTRCMNQSEVVFKKHKRWLALNRGVCKHCEEPVVATLFNIFSFIPARNYQEKSRLPDAEARIFYSDTCVSQSQIAAAAGYWKSQLLVCYIIAKGLFKFGR